ncbi:hypothetical protein ACFC6L_17555 [Kitasatospora phosalacinea]|uniref:hypothetical protein n=1 Tax=Kitasatospora phosalacinea TaxID=2065 RepID=UPI0035DA9A8B
MNQYRPDVVAWAADNSENCRSIFTELGERPDLMRADPISALRRIESELGAGWQPNAMPDEEWVQFRTFLMVVLAEFLISYHGARWEWAVDPSSPLGGRWTVAGFPHPLGQETRPVDVGGIVNDTRSMDDVSFVSLVNRAEAESGMREIAG